jgi:hypothetical protein
LVGGEIIDVQEALSLEQAIQDPTNIIAGHVNTASLDVLRDTVYSIDPIYILFTVVSIIAILFLTSTAAKIVDSALQIYIPRFTARVVVKMDQTIS